MFNTMKHLARFYTCTKNRETQCAIELLLSHRFTNETTLPIIHTIAFFFAIRTATELGQSCFLPFLLIFCVV